VPRAPPFLAFKRAVSRGARRSAHAGAVSWVNVKPQVRNGSVTVRRLSYGYGAYEFRGNVHWGCSMGNQWKYSFGGWRAPRGSACAELWAQDWRVRVARQCHDISG